MGRLRHPATVLRTPEGGCRQRRASRCGRRHGHPGKQAAGDAAVSRFAAGVDCSGFVSRCWRLDRPFSTRELPALCTRLPSWEDLRTGDILIVPGRHVLLFIQWEGTEKSRFLGSEAGPLPAWKCSEHVFSRSMLENSGYRPMRYRGMRD